jgi:hypothetical protein
VLNLFIGFGEASLKSPASAREMRLNLCVLNRAGKYKSD